MRFLSRISRQKKLITFQPVEFDFRSCDRSLVISINRIKYGSNNMNFLHYQIKQLTIFLKFLITFYDFYILNYTTLFEFILLLCRRIFKDKPLSFIIYIRKLWFQKSDIDNIILSIVTFEMHSIGKSRGNYRNFSYATYLIFILELWCRKHVKWKF